MARYELAAHVFACVSDGHLVFLDIRQDRYWMLDASMTADLLEADEAREATGPQKTPVCERLAQKGLLVEGNGRRAIASAGDFASPQRELISDLESASAYSGHGSWTTFVRAALMAKALLRMRSFQHVIARVRRRKQQSGLTDITRPDAELCRSLVAAFLRYRVFLFSSRNECLYDCLALIEFLARHGIHPDWHFGVQARPFAAHCWLQQQGVVLNDTVDHVAGYTPIMVV